MMRWTWMLLGVTLWTMASAGAAHACACCDSETRRKIVGWSEDGQSAIVEMYDNAACEQIYALEVWEVGSPAPTSCFDRVHGPDKQIACSEVDFASSVEGPDGRDGRPRPSRATARFPGPVKRLPASRIRLTRSRLKKHGPEVHVTVSVRSGGQWHRVWDTRGARVGPLYTEGAFPKVRIFPSPDGKAALLALSSFNGSPGTGHYPTELFWITLP